MKWRQFKQEMPKENTRLLICGIISTDPLEQCTNYQFTEFIDYKDGMLISDGDEYRVCVPDPEDYWMYARDIQTPFEGNIMPLKGTGGKTIYMKSNETYITGGPDFTVFFLPEHSNAGDTIEIYSTAEFKVQPLNPKEQIIFFSTTTSDGLRGSITTHSRGQWIKLLCTLDNLEWIHIDSRGNFIIE